MALDQLGNESQMDYILKQGGKMYGKPDGTTTWVYLGESHEVLHSFEVEKDTIPDTESCTPGTAASYITSTKLALNWSSYSYTPENIARAFAGEVTEGAAAVTDEAYSTPAVKKGEYVMLPYTQIDTLIVMDDGDLTTYVEGTDYTIDMKAGILGIIIGGAITDDDILNLTVTTTEGKESVQYLKGTSTQMAIRFVGCASSGVSTMIDFYNAEVVADGDTTIKGEEVASINFSADCLADPSKAGGAISEYATMTLIG